jgi:hypothetical protein
MFMIRDFLPADQTDARMLIESASRFYVGEENGLLVRTAGLLYLEDRARIVRVDRIDRLLRTSWICPVRQGRC